MISHASAADPPGLLQAAEETSNFSRLNLSALHVGRVERVLCDDVCEPRDLDRTCLARAHLVSITSPLVYIPLRRYTTRDTKWFYIVIRATTIIILCRCGAWATENIIPYLHNILYIYIGKQPAAGNLFEIFRARKTRACTYIIYIYNNILCEQAHRSNFQVTPINY